MEADERPEQARAEAELRDDEESWLPAGGVFSVGDPPQVGDEVGLTSEWAVPWSDLMMVMFILFVVLFVYHSAEREIETAFQPRPAAEQRAQLDPSLGQPFPRPSAPEVFEQSLEAVRQADLEDVEVVLQQDRSVKVSLRGSVFFELGQAELGDPSRAFLDRLAEVIGRNDRSLQVIGHTDNFPIHSEQFPTNWELSAARAAAVARYLIRRGNLDPGRFSIVGRSMYEPAAPNSSFHNKALNRRVELVIAADPPGEAS